MGEQRWSGSGFVVVVTMAANVACSSPGPEPSTRDAAVGGPDATTGSPGADGGGTAPEGDGSTGGPTDAGLVCHPVVPSEAGIPSVDAGLGTACTTAAQCGATLGCVAGACAACTQAADCGASETCSAGVCSSTCQTTLQAIVDATPTGGTVTVPSCTFRESVVLTKPIALLARPGAEIRGSDVWTGWVKGTKPGTWTSTARLAAPVSNDPCHCVECAGDAQCAARTCTTAENCACAAAASCYLPQQVFVDDAPLAQVATSAVAAGQFYVDMGTGIVTLGSASDPGASRVEVTTRAQWMTSAAPLGGVTVQGFTMRHAASQPQHGALDSTGAGGKCGAGGGWVVRSNRFLYAAGGALTLNAYDRILGNELAFGGQEGANSTCFDHGLMQGNYVHDNNTENFSAGWEAAGVKGTKTVGATYDGNVVTHNLNGAAGLWSDINTYDATYTNNYVADNSGNGIMYEISDKAFIACNVARDNGPTASCCSSPQHACAAGEGCNFFGGAQILISASPDVTVTRNTVSGSMGIGLLQQYRTDSCVDAGGCSTGVCSGVEYHRLASTVVTDNDITESQDAPSAGFLDGLSEDVCVRGACNNGVKKSDGGAVACDSGGFFNPAVARFSGNTYHVSSCASADWEWEGGAAPFDAWSAAVGDAGETCVP